jgi:protein O-mannosyl-transferase
MSRIALIRILLVAAILATFGRIVLNDFVDWDDGKLIYLNPNINNPTWRGLERQWNPKDPNTNSMYDPLVYTTWWALAHAAQLDSSDILGAKLNPQIFHLANLLVHCATALVVLEILRLLAMPDWAAAAGAALFALHPIQTEAVAWATGMKDLLGGLLAMLTIWRYLVAVGSSGNRRRENYLLATLFYAAALLAKPSTVVLPPIVAVLDLVIFRRKWRDVAVRIAPWLVMAAVVIGLATKIQNTAPLQHTPLWARGLIALDSLTFYFYKLLLPIRLSFDYGRNTGALFYDPKLHHPLYWSWVFPIALAVILWRLRRPMLTAGGLVFMLGVLPVLGLASFVFQYYTNVADRYVYVSMLGVAMAAAWLMSRYSNRITVGIVCAVLAVLGSLSFVQAGIWQDSDSLYEHALGLNRTSAIHYIILGQYKVRIYEAAIKRAALDQQNGDFDQTRNELRDADQYLSQAFDAFHTLIALDPKDQTNYDGFTASLYGDLFGARRWKDALEVYEVLIKLPYSAEALHEIPEVPHKTLAMLYIKNGQYARAVDELTTALKIKPDPQVQKLLDETKAKMAASTRGE